MQQIIDREIENNRAKVDQICNKANITLDVFKRQLADSLIESSVDYIIKGQENNTEPIGVIKCHVNAE